MGGFRILLAALPLFVKRVYRDDEYIAKLADAVDSSTRTSRNLWSASRRLEGEGPTLTSQLSQSLEAA
jgi:hypothetical protein